MWDYIGKKWDQPAHGWVSTNAQRGVLTIILGNETHLPLNPLIGLIDTVSPKVSQENRSCPITKTCSKSCELDLLVHVHGKLLTDDYSQISEYIFIWPTVNEVLELLHTIYGHAHRSTMDLNFIPQLIADICLVLNIELNSESYHGYSLKYKIHLSWFLTSIY